ncbi:MAG: hypothetical protein ABIE22_02310 [archaeon]
MKKRGVGKLNLLLITIAAIIVIAGAYIGLNKITGYQVATDVQLEIGCGNPGQIIYVSLPSTVSPFAGTFRPISFSFHAYDPDGVDCIDFTTAEANMTRVGEAVRQDIFCDNPNNISDFIANFSCTVDMWYWDSNGAWRINASVTDDSGMMINDTVLFTYGIITSYEISPTLVTFGSPLSIGSVNQIPTDPTTVNNSGNDVGIIEINSSNLTGESNGDYYIWPSNFTASPSAATVCTSPNQLQWSLWTATGVYLNRGNLSLSPTSVGWNRTYYCMPQVPANLIPQVYSTTETGIQWEVQPN